MIKLGKVNKFKNDIDFRLQHYITFFNEYLINIFLPQISSSKQTLFLYILICEDFGTCTFNFSCPSRIYVFHAFGYRGPGMREVNKRVHYRVGEGKHK